MRSKAIEERKKKLFLTSNQREIIVGLLLGDGCLETQNTGRTYRLKVEHGASQSKYVDWLYRQFVDWVLTPPQMKDKADQSQNVWFQTISHPALRFYAQQFYVNGRRQVPRIIAKLITPLGLAVWFMDDGSLKSKDHRALILNTHCFSSADLSLLQKVLLIRFDIEAQFRHQKDGTQLLLTEPSASRLAEIIQPYLLPEFWYKLGKVGLTQLPKE